MKQLDSSTQASFDVISVLVGALAMVAAATLTLELVQVARSITEADLRVAWLIAMAITLLGVMSAASQNQSLKPLETVVPIGGVVGLVLAMLTGSAFVTTIIILTGVGWALAAPLTEWACGTGKVVHAETPKARAFQLSSGRAGSNPIPSALVVGMLLFSLPAPLTSAAPLAVGFLAAVISLASLGHMRDGARKLPGKVQIEDRAFVGWLPIVAALLLLCLLGGVGVPFALARQKGIDVNNMTHQGLVSFRTLEGNRPSPLEAAGGTRESDIKTGSKPKHGDIPQGKPKPSDKGPKQPARPQPKPPPPPPPKPQDDLRDRLLKLLALGAAAALLMAVARRYGAVIWSAVRTFASWVLSPFILFASRVRERRRARGQDRAIAELLAREPNPFEPIAREPVAEDLPVVYDRILAFAGLHDCEPAVGETASNFFRRLATVYSVDRKDLSAVDRVCTAWNFASVPPSRNEVAVAAQAANRICEKLANLVPPGELEARQVRFRRKLAVRTLNEAAAEPTTAGTTKS